MVIILRDNTDGYQMVEGKIKDHG